MRAEVHEIVCDTTNVWDELGIYFQGETTQHLTAEIEQTRMMVGSSTTVP